MSKEPKCTLTDEQLIQVSSEWITKLCKTGGQAWILRVPVDFNRDPDILFHELGRRLTERNTLVDQMALSLEEAKLQIEYLHVKFTPTGTGNAFLSRLTTILEQYEKMKLNG